MRQGLIALLMMLWAVPVVAQSTYAAENCTLAEVAAKVALAVDGDTVTVPACAETTWDSALTITQAITLQGAGSGSTLIKGNLSGADVLKGVIYYIPDSAGSSTFRITGFRIDADDKSNCIGITNSSASVAETIRIDHNILVNQGGANASRGIVVAGIVYGVIDNNTFDDNTDGTDKTCDFYGGNSYDQWNNLKNDRAFGSAHNLYFEDNTVSSGNTFHSSGQGGRYVLRYNTYTYTNTGSHMAPVFDIHGNQSSSFGSMVNEIYGNSINLQTKGAGTFVDLRGGRALMFFNSLQSGAGVASGYAREECTDDYFPTSGAPHAGLSQHAQDSYVWKNYDTYAKGFIAFGLNTGENCCSINAAWQGTYNYYLYSGGYSNYCDKFGTANCWKMAAHVGTNLSGSTEPDWSGTAPGASLVDGDYTWLNMGPNDTPLTANAANADVFWGTNSGSFDGTGNTSAGGGVGCGTLAARPATCTTGVGYWATTQSCSDLTGMVGANPSTPLSGTLYKCTATDTWTSYYTPYAYPHPLRGEAVPAAPTNVRIK